MEREAGGTEPEPILGRMIAVEDYISCGFIPPPSEFLLLVLNFYGISLVHLNPNSIAFLSIFSYLCGAYIGVEPFLDLFCFYYELRWMESNREQPDKIPEWTTKPALTHSLQSFIDIVDDLQVRGLSGYEVTADFIGLNSDTVARHVGQVMISGPVTASDIPVPLCEKGPVEREAAINSEYFDLTPCLSCSGLECVSPASAKAKASDAWRKGELQAEMERILQAGARGLGREIEEARSAASSANQRADKLARDLAEACEDLMKMRELVAGNERQRQGLKHRMSELENNLSEIRGSLRADLESALADRDRRIQYWRTKFEVAELERTMVEVEKDQAEEDLQGREVWFNSYVGSCCTAMVGVYRELRVSRGNPEESAAGYISWLNGAYTQLEGIGKRIDEALKQECRRSSRYAEGHVLACIRDHCPQLHLEFLHEAFSCSRRTPAEIDDLAKSMAPLTEKVFQSMDWRWPSW
uniref:OSJNBa0040D17.7 protein n=1 Tax=Oryza sativa subsp. japonica TaxID=39947 RepID=Q7XMM0_ORYSJ|nr:OSJNBa0040D17.7 [Oryza sativa Japonica Group]